MMTKKPAPDTVSTSEMVEQPQVSSDLSAASMSPSQSQPKKMKWLVWALVGLAVAAVAGIALAAWHFVPLKLITRAFERFENYKSVEMSYTSPVYSGDKRVTVKADIVEDEASLSKITLDIPEMELEEGKTASFNMDMLVSEKDFYIKGVFSAIAEVEQALTEYPIITETETYRLALPVMKGESYLHIPIPDDSEDEETASDELTDKDIEKLTKSAEEVYLVRSFNPFHYQDGKRYTKIVLGMRKNKLLKFIDDVKDTNLDIKVSQVNAMKKIVESSDDWNGDLITVMIDDKHNVRSITMRMPEIPEDVLSENLAESVSNKDELTAMVKQATTQIEKTVDKYTGKDKPKFMELGEIRFDKFDSVESFEKPTQIAEMDEILAAAEEELAPVLGAILTGQELPKAQNTPVKTSPSTSTNKVRPAGCVMYQIQNGPLASNKCYAPADAETLGSLIKQRNDSINSAQASFDEAQNKCNNGDQGACSQAETIYNQAGAQIQSYEQQIRTIVGRGV